MCDTLRMAETKEEHAIESKNPAPQEPQSSEQQMMRPRRQRGRSAPPRLLVSGPYGTPTELLSPLNVYIRGLPSHFSDKDLFDLCSQYGQVTSAKAMLEPDSKKCKGFGFVLFKDHNAALTAISSLSSQGYQASFAKLSNTDRMAGVAQEDPTNLYFANLPLSLNEDEFRALLSPYGKVISCRLLKDHDTGANRGVGLARMANRDACLAVIENIDGKQLEGSNDAAVCKFADAPLHKRFKQLTHHFGSQHVLSSSPQPTHMSPMSPMSPMSYVPTPAYPTMIPTQVAYVTPTIFVPSSPPYAMPTWAEHRSISDSVDNWPRYHSEPTRSRFPYSWS